MPQTTEAERLVVQRVGQGLFRGALMDYWQGKCCVTGLDVPELLRASHIRPWAKCENDEQRLDVFNGLLLAPHLDALFDGGWISFQDDGQIISSPKLTPVNKAQLAYVEHWRISQTGKAHCPYLAFHRERIFRR